MTADSEFDRSEPFSWSDILRVRADRDLQRWHWPLFGKLRYLLKAQRCPGCGRRPWRLAWFYYRSPKWTWETLCGRAGWMTACDRCRTQVDLFVEVMS